MLGLRKCEVTDYEGNGEYWVSHGNGLSTLVLEDELVPVHTGFVIRKQCYESDSAKVTLEKPEGNPIFSEKKAAFDYAESLAEKEVESLNDGAVPGVSFGIPCDDDYHALNCVKVYYYYNPEGDCTGNTMTVTVYHIELVSYGVVDETDEKMNVSERI